MNKFINFLDVDIKDPTSWQGKSILSFDIDWAIDEVIQDVLDIVEEAGSKCTFFVTHKTELLERMRANPNIELGIHPNFNPLINSESNAKTAKETLANLFHIVPEAKVLRSHSMTHSARWLELYKEIGITHLSQYYMNGVETIQPFSHINRLVEVPVYFADDGYIYMKDENSSDIKSISDYLSTTSYMKVFNFHPIHLSLNTDSFNFYNKTRNSHSNWNQLKEKRNANFGMRNVLLNIINGNENNQ